MKIIVVTFYAAGKLRLCSISRGGCATVRYKYYISSPRILLINIHHPKSQILQFKSYKWKFRHYPLPKWSSVPLSLLPSSGMSFFILIWTGERCTTNTNFPSLAAQRQFTPTIHSSHAADNHRNFGRWVRWGSWASHREIRSRPGSRPRLLPARYLQQAGYVLQGQLPVQQKKCLLGLRMP